MLFSSKLSLVQIDDRANNSTVDIEGVEDLPALIDAEHLPVIDSLRRIVIELLNQPVRQVVIEKPVSANQRTPTDFTNEFREQLLKIQAELQERLQSGLATLAAENNDELVVRLQEQIEVNDELKERVEKLSFNIQKVLLAVQEELDRLHMIHEYDRKLTTVEDFRSQISATKEKVAEMLDPGLADKLTLNEEYENQRRLWQEKINQQASRFADDLKRLREELENQKNVTIRQEEELNEQIDQIRADYENSQRRHREETDNNLDKIKYLEQEKDSLNEYIEGIKESKVELQNIITEREDTILECTNRVNEWQAKCSFMENDIRKTLNEKNKMQDLVFEKDKEVEVLKEEIYELQSNIDRLNEAVNRLERIQKENERDLLEKRERILKLENTFELERSSLLDKNDQISREYKEYVEDCENTTDQLKDDYENLMREYTVQLEDLRRQNDHMRKNHQNEVDAHIADIRRLTQMNQETSELAGEQADIIRTKEEKLNRLSDELRYYLSGRLNILTSY